MSDDHAAGFQIAVDAAGKTAVEPPEKPVVRLALFLGTQQQRTERRTQRQRVDPRQANADGDRDGELSVEFPGCARHQSDRQKYGHQHRRRRNDRRSDGLHRRDRGVPAVHAFFDIHLDGFDDYDGVVDYQPDREYQSEQRKDVD